MFDNAFLSVGRRDVRLWKLDINCKFSVKSYFHSLTSNSDRVDNWHSFWVPSVTPRVFDALLGTSVSRWHRILTFNKLRRQNNFIVNRRLMCLKDEESVHHLMVPFFFAQRVWIAIFFLFDVQWFMPKLNDDLFRHWGLWCQ